MYWDFRIMRHKKGKDVWYALHDVFYDSKGKIEGWTAGGEIPSESKEELIETLLIMLRDAKRRRKMLEYGQE